MIPGAFLFLSLFGICVASPSELEPLSDEQISFINKVQNSWTAGRNFEPNELERIKGLLGVYRMAKKSHNDLQSLPVTGVEMRDDLPKQFDSQKQWPQCKSITEVRDQSACASAWAVAPVEVMTDRLCIHANVSVHLSAEEINDCDIHAGSGCAGGDPWHVWDYFEQNGVVSGGNYNSNQGCMPYTLPPCDLYVKGPRYKPCPRQPYKTPNCAKKCRKGYGKTYEQDKHFGLQKKMFDGEKAIMQELVDNGPVIAIINAYEDFLSYKSGIYKHTRGRLLGYHIVKIIGYGVEKGQKYWRCVNSWNEDWGDKGFFKISKGNNECTIELGASAANPKV